MTRAMTTHRIGHISHTGAASSSLTQFTASQARLTRDISGPPEISVNGRLARDMDCTFRSYRSDHGVGAIAVSDTANTLRGRESGTVPVVNVASPEDAPERGVIRMPGRPDPVARWIGRSGIGRLVAARWPLIMVLAVQAILSLRLTWSNTAFQDEGLYLRAGHLEWARWLHQAPVPDFPSSFSGAPVIYPPLGAVADSLGGLAAARVLSLGFMLAVTSLLWATAGRLYGRRAALLAAGLFATLAGTQFLGAFATFDAMALFLLALAAWLGVRAADYPFRTRTTLLVATAVILAAANATKYVTAVFTPVVFVVVCLAVWRRREGGAWLVALLTVLCSWIALAGTAIAVGGRDYWRGITASTLARPQADVPVTAVLRSAYIWTSLILLLAVLGAVLAAWRRAREAPSRRPDRRRPARPGRAGSPAHHSRPAEARRVRCLVRRDRGGLRDGAAEPGRSGSRLGRRHGAAYSRIYAVRLTGPGGRVVRGVAERGRGGPRHRLGGSLPSGQLPGRGLRRRGLLSADRSSLAAMVQHVLFPLPAIASRRILLFGRDRPPLLHARDPGLRGHGGDRRADHRGHASGRWLPRAGPGRPVHHLGVGG